MESFFGKKDSPETKVGQSGLLESHKKGNPGQFPVFAYYGARRGWIIVPERLRKSEAKEGPGELQVTQLSQGYQSMLALGMDFSRRLALANGNGDSGAENQSAPAIMLVDEIDLHLHPGWQQRVLPDLMRTFPKTQFIVNTHSPQVLSTVRRQNIRILNQDSNGCWKASLPDGNPYAHSNAMALEAVMGGQSYPQNETYDMLQEYQRLVGSGDHDSTRALDLRKSLELEWGEKDPELLLMDITIRKNQTLRKLGNLTK